MDTIREELKKRFVLVPNEATVQLTFDQGSMDFTLTILVNVNLCGIPLAGVAWTERIWTDDGPDDETRNSKMFDRFANRILEGFKSWEIVTVAD